MNRKMCHAKWNRYAKKMLLFTQFGIEKTALLPFLFFTIFRFCRPDFLICRLFCRADSDNIGCAA